MRVRFTIEFGTAVIGTAVSLLLVGAYDILSALGRLVAGSGEWRSYMSRQSLFFCAGLLSAAFLPFAFGQSTFGSFTGMVKDPTGALVPAATVEVTNEGTGTSRQVTTNSAGVFNVPNLDLGVYQVRISAKGFA